MRDPVINLPRRTIVEHLRTRSDAQRESARRTVERAVSLEREAAELRIDARFLTEEAVEAMVAADILDRNGLTVTTTKEGFPHVSVNPPPEMAQAVPPEPETHR